VRGIRGGLLARRRNGSNTFEASLVQVRRILSALRDKSVDHAEE
jgi:hypothetical protein